MAKPDGVSTSKPRASSKYAGTGLRVGDGRGREASLDLGDLGGQRGE
jgi:hypothetical protein